MIWSTHARPYEGRELPPHGSYLEYEARVVNLASKLIGLSDESVAGIERGKVHRPILREAARRELLRRRVMGGRG